MEIRLKAINASVVNSAFVRVLNESTTAAASRVTVAKVELYPKAAKKGNWNLCFA